MQNKVRGGVSVLAVVRKEEGKLLGVFYNDGDFIMLILGLFLSKIINEVTG